MRKTFIIIIILLLSSACCFAQYENDLHKTTFNLPPKAKTAGDHLIKSANYQYASFGLAITSGVLAYCAFPSEPSVSSRDGKIYMYAGIGCCAGALVCTLAAIHHKRMAGIKLNKSASLDAYVNPNGVTLALRF